MTPSDGAETRTRPAGVAAASTRAGDRETLDALFRAHLPMVVNLVRRALGGSPDVDDVVQDVVLHALREQPELREPGSVRPWLAGITACQIATHLARAETAAEHPAPLDLDSAAWKPDADIEGSALLRVELAGQRRQVRNARRWLSAEDRAPLSLWLLEVAGELSRADLAAALGLSVAHAGVRLHRMREQLCLSRTIVVALEAMPGCDELSAAIADWNGVPSPFWRKRLARHTRSCPVCLGAAESLIPVEQLLVGVAPMPACPTLADTAARIPRPGQARRAPARGD